MPKKVDRSNLMTSEEYFRIYKEYKSIIFYTVKKLASKYPVHRRPGQGSPEDTVQEVILELYRLGYCASYDASKACGAGKYDDAKKSFGIYLGAQVENILSHMWQDYVRLYRTKVSLAPMSAAGESGIKDYSIIDDTTKWDPNISWSSSSDETDDDTGASMLMAALANYVEPKNRMARKALELIKNNQVLASDPSVTALVSALNKENPAVGPAEIVSRGQAHTILGTIQAAAKALMYNDDIQMPKTVSMEQLRYLNRNNQYAPEYIPEEAV